VREKDGEGDDDERGATEHGIVLSGQYAPIPLVLAMGNSKSLHIFM
jgi:hypothetical protein